MTASAMRRQGYGLLSPLGAGCSHGTGGMISGGAAGSCATEERLDASRSQHRPCSR